MSEPTLFFNIIRLPEGRETEALAAWREISVWMSAAPGCLSTKLHRCRHDPSRLINHAQFESMEAFQALTTQSEFKSLSAKMTELGVEREAGVYDVITSWS